MARQITTSAKPIGYYCTVAPHIEEIFGSHFENLQRGEQFALLSTLSIYMAFHFNEGDGDDEHYSLIDAYNDTPAQLTPDVVEILADLECVPDDTLIGLAHALIAHIGG